MYKPILRHGQYAVVKAKMRLGIFADAGTNLWRIFNSLRAARSFALAEVGKQSSVHCGIYNASGRQLLSLRS